MYLNKHRAFYCSKFIYSWWHASANYHVYKHYKVFVCFNYKYKLLFIALFDDFNLIISIFHCLCPSFYLYLSNLLS